MPAGSIAVTPMSFWPATIGSEIANLPFSSAAPDTVRFEVAFQIRTSLRACVSPSIEAVFALTTAPSRGLLTTIRGFVASKTYVTTGDGSDSPASDDDRRGERVRAVRQRDVRDDEADGPADRDLGDDPGLALADRDVDPDPVAVDARGAFRDRPDEVDLRLVRVRLVGLLDQRRVGERRWDH